jgi:hypothetical protein
LFYAIRIWTRLRILFKLWFATQDLINWFT